MSETRCPSCGADIEQRLSARVMDGAGMWFRYTCDCGQDLDIDVRLYLEFTIEPREDDHHGLEK